MDPVEDREHSPLRNVTGGAGCGCGCLGLNGVLVGGAALVAIPMELYDGGPGNMVLVGSVVLATGLFTVVAGIAIWGGSLFMD